MHENDNPFEETFLVITEKPSVAMLIASVLGFRDKKDGYIEGPDGVVSWCFGHLAEFVLPEAYDPKYRTWSLDTLPIIPDQWKLTVPGNKMKQFRILSGLLNNSAGDKKFRFDYVVNAADPGREGEEIFNRVYALSGSHLPVKRLWVSSMEDKAIMEAFLNMKDGSEYKNLGEAALCRAQADWLVGINASRAFTKTYDCRFSVGRVQSPTLAMLVERNDRIAAFKKEQYFVTHLQVDSLGHTIDAVSEKFSDREESNRLAGMCKGRMATVPTIERQTRTVAPPKLYDLTTLQRDANRLFDFTASRTLECAQALYEDKLITYPRTDSNYLSDDMEQAAEDILLTCTHVFSFLEDGSDDYDDYDGGAGDVAPDVSRLLNNEKVTDHHAIIPTEEVRRKGYSDCSADERKILFLIAARLACAVAKPYIYDIVKATFLCCGYSFTSVGRSVKQEGWKAVESAMRKALLLPDPETQTAPENMEEPVGEDENGNSTSRADDSGKHYQDLSSLYQGAQFFPAATRVTNHWTQPPRYFTEDTLLHAMETAGTAEMDLDVERKGLGTPATRAGIIDKLVSSKYAVRKNKQIIPTEEGKKLISLLPDYLKSAGMTADWENKLLLIERGKYDSRDFMAGISAMLEQMLAECRQINDKRNHLPSNAAGTDAPADMTQDKSGRSGSPRMRSAHDNIGNCPVCGSPVYEGEKNFYCSNRECRFTLWKKNRYLDRLRVSLDKGMAKDLLANGRTHVKDFYSAKKGKYFEADLLMRWEEGMVQYSLVFS